MTGAARILVVDDQEEVRSVHSRVLSAQGFRVEVAESAEAALVLLRAEPFDAILSDISMPGMSGLAMAKELRASKIAVPVVLITGNPELETAVEAVEVGILRYLSKPVNARALANVTHEVIRLQGLARAEQLALDNAGLRSLVEELHRARNAAQAASRAKSEFLAVMSHELRTPLGQVIGYADLVLDDNLTPEQHQWVGTLKRSAVLTLRMLQHILDLADLAGRKVQLTSDAFDVWNLVGEAVKRFEQTASAKNLALRFAIDPRVPRRLKGDGPKLAQLVEHVLDNALKFTETGHVDVRMDLEPSTSGRAVVRVSVADTGIGIPREAQEQVLDPFLQADGSSTRRYGGAGLGLAISAELARLMGGAIELESTVGIGTSVRFTASFETLLRT